MAFLGTQISRPYIPILVENVNGPLELASAIGFVTGTAALVGALMSPAGGWLGDRIGFRPVLVAGLLGGGDRGRPATLPGQRRRPGRGRARLQRGATRSTAAMVFGLLATEVPEERRSATLNLVYLPLYAAGIIGPIVGAIVVGRGIWAPFAVAAIGVPDAVPSRLPGHDGPAGQAPADRLIRAARARTHRRRRQRRARQAQRRRMQPGGQQAGGPDQKARRRGSRSGITARSIARPPYHSAGRASIAATGTAQ